MRRRLVVCTVGAVSGPLQLPGSRWAPERRLISGGERSLYELAVAASCAGWDVELRGAINELILTKITAAAGGTPRVGLDPRRPEEGEIVVVPEVADHELLAALRLSGATAVFDLLAPPGLWGWSFLHGWVPGDPNTVDLESIASSPTYRAIHEFGITMWSPSHGAAHAGRKAGVPVEWIGTGTPVPFPEVPEKAIDVAIVAENRWAAVAEKVYARLAGVSVLRVPLQESTYSLSEMLAPARILLWPSRIEGMSRVAREARGVGTVPVALDTNPFVTEEDHGGGVVLVPDVRSLGDQVVALLEDPARLEQLRSEAVESARLQVAWRPYVERIGAALESLSSAEHPAAAAAGLVGDSLWRMLNQTRVEAELRVADLESLAGELAAHRESLSQQLGIALEEMRTQRLLLEERLRAASAELQSARAEVDAYKRRRIVRLLDWPVLSRSYSLMRRLMG